MNILILEDEREAAAQLVQMVQRIDPTANIIATIETVRKTCNWLSVHPHPDLILADIQLADGISLDVFAKVKVNVPVILSLPTMNIP
jgi:two-component system response regulator LytT